MAFTVEDGTGVAGANAYTAVADVDAYWLDRANSTWAAAETAAKQAAIITATDYIELRFRKRFLGYREFEAQPLSFPRLNLYDNDGELIEGIPDRLKYAVAEYALRALSAALLPDPTFDDRGLKVKSKREKVGPIEEETTYEGGIAIYRPYPSADLYLSEYLAPSGRVIRG